MLRKTLAKAGYAIITANDGKEGLRHFDSQIIDLVITDLIMPEMEGLETIRRLRKQHKGTKIIAISGGGRTDPASYLNVAKLLGAAHALRKPIRRKELLEAVQDVCPLD